MERCFMRKKLWIIGFLVIVVYALTVAAHEIIAVDPYFHYHAPNTQSYFYPLNNQRSQNDGICKHFDYEGLITGTSMTENFKTTEAEELFGMQFVKVSYSGGTYNEINRSLAVAAAHNPDLKCIIRGLDMGRFIEDKDSLRNDLGTYPAYLYDDSWINDAEYVFNRDVLFSRVYPMTKENDTPGFAGGITSFDAYSNWMGNYTFGHHTLFPDGFTAKDTASPVELTREDIDLIKGNIQQNVVALAEKYPDITFYYFFTPYSAAWWQVLLTAGTLDRQIDAEKTVIEEILKCDNIKLFSFNCLFDVTTDLNNYKDVYHYGEWINSLILRFMHDGKCQLNEDNYQSYIEEERKFYKTYDYAKMTEQQDYADDYYAAMVLEKEISGTES